VCGVQVMLAVAILVVGLGMLGLALVFALNAIRRTKAREATRTPEPYPQPVPPALESPRGMWAGAGISAVLGMAALIGAAVVLIALMAAPTRVLHAPAQAGGLKRDDSPDTQQLTSRQRERLKAAGMPNPLTAVYRQPTEASTTVLFIGASGHIDAPATQLKQFLSELAESAGADGREPTGYPAGHLRGTVMCLDQLNTGQATLATCGWADEGTLGVITTDEGDAAQTANLLLSMRDDMETTA
jgi:hypothetical protein